MSSAALVPSGAGLSVRPRTDAVNGLAAGLPQRSRLRRTPDHGGVNSVLHSHRVPSWRGTDVRRRRSISRPSFSSVRWSPGREDLGGNTVGQTVRVPGGDVELVETGSQPAQRSQGGVQLYQRRERYGFSYYIVTDQYMQTLAPVVAQLTGKA